MNPFINASPIWHPAGSSVNQTVLFSGRGPVNDPAKCVMYVHAHCNYALYVNDAFVASGSFSDYENYRVYDEIPLKDTVAPGENLFSLYVYNQGEDSFIYRD